MSHGWYEAPTGQSGPPMWAPYNYQTFNLRTASPATGVAGETIVATLGPVPAGELWAVTRSTVSVVYVTPESFRQQLPVCRHYLDVISPPIVSGTNSGDYDEADYPYPGLWVPEGRSLLAVWGAAAGAAIGVQATGTGYWTVQVARLRRGG